VDGRAVAVDGTVYAVEGNPWDLAVRATLAKWGIPFGKATQADYLRASEHLESVTAARYYDGDAVVSGRAA
jgi:hypothetical protein